MFASFGISLGTCRQCCAALSARCRASSIRCLARRSAFWLASAMRRCTRSSIALVEAGSLAAGLFVAAGLLPLPAPPSLVAGCAIAGDDCTAAPTIAVDCALTAGLALTSSVLGWARGCSCLPAPRSLNSLSANEASGISSSGDSCGPLFICIGWTAGDCKGSCAIASSALDELSEPLSDPLSDSGSVAGTADSTTGKQGVSLS
mmetsp:Transcript_112857/g.211615  ORF Transcript_112857/g.211615 Transcript_112857/m.211615 type:complete len:204 (+) Transcript_112857:354-965(+)